MNVEFSVGCHIGNEKDHDEDDGIGVGDDEPVRNVPGEQLDERICAEGGGRGGQTEEADSQEGCPRGSTDSLHRAKVTLWSLGLVLFPNLIHFSSS